EYEQLSAFSANIGVNEIGSVFKLGNTVDRLGLDTNEAGWICSFVMECFEKRILTGVDTDGLEMYWGNAEATRQLLHKIASRESLGNVLAEGVKRAAAEIGNGAEQIGVYSMKGGTPRGHDHRARWTELFDTVVSDSGALDNTLAVADLTQFGLPEKIDPFDPDMLAQAEGKMKGAMQFEDSLVTCRFNTLCDIDLLSEAVAAVTGWDFTPEEAMEVGRRTVHTMRAFNIRNGITGDMERPSERYGSTPTDGPAEGKAILPHFEKMLQDYYKLMGWDENGTPLPETLEKVGLGEAVAELWPGK
ncbi:MAG: aldehyde ferredoxin oxidoreductase C-terminal domain-containing protein, partial [Dehalococcoidia bacterium]|nr:aldehyde ferredoxin oxidoreductase C-terminal domain-containing protein [Dehalococcoidia bacterium]